VPFKFSAHAKECEIKENKRVLHPHLGGKIFSGTQAIAVTKYQKLE
jgi:hypothetical protein